MDWGFFQVYGEGQNTSFWKKIYYSCISGVVWCEITQFIELQQLNFITSAFQK